MDNGTANWRESEGKKVRPISLFHIWRLRMETRRLATESGRRMGVVRRFIYNQRWGSATPAQHSQCSQPREPPTHAERVQRGSRCQVRTVVVRPRPLLAYSASPRTARSS